MRVESAFIWANAPTATWVITASAPPATMTSASPRWIARADSPSAWPLVAQAEAMLMFGPRQLSRIAIWPARMFGADCRMKKGEIFLKPPSLQTSCVATISGRPPRPTPRFTPIRSGGREDRWESSPESM